MITTLNRIDGSSQILKSTRPINAIQIEVSLQVIEPHWFKSHDQISPYRCIDPQRPTTEPSLPIQVKNGLNRPFWLSSKSRSSFSSRGSKREKTPPSNSCASLSIGRCSRLSVANKATSSSDKTRSSLTRPGGSTSPISKLKKSGIAFTSKSTRTSPRNSRMSARKSCLRSRQAKPNQMWGNVPRVPWFEMWPKVVPKCSQSDQSRCLMPERFQPPDAMLLELLLMPTTTPMGDLLATTLRYHPWISPSLRLASISKATLSSSESTKLWTDFTSGTARVAKIWLSKRKIMNTTSLLRRSLKLRKKPKWNRKNSFKTTRKERNLRNVSEIKIKGHLTNLW